MKNRSKIDADFVFPEMQKRFDLYAPAPEHIIGGKNPRPIYENVSIGIQSLANQFDLSALVKGLVD